jgi:hypothetical protein
MVPIKKRLHFDSKGQSTVEYLIVGSALLVIITALGLLGAKLGDGWFVEQAAQNASHAFGSNIWGAIGDVLLY